MEKRKPLSDITNTYNLTPTTALRELIAASSSSKSFSKPLISISKSNSNSTNRKFFSESSSKSNTSIGSSSVGATLSSKKTVQFWSPPTSISSVNLPGKQREIGKGITGNSPCSLEKRDVGEEGILKYSRSSTVKIKETGQERLNLSGFFAERGRDKGKPLNTFKSLHEITREKGKAILQPSDIVEITESTKEKSKALNTFNTSYEKTKEKGKAILQPSDIVEITESTNDKSKPLNNFNTSYEKTEEKGKQNLQHPDIVEVADHKGSFDAVIGKSRPSRRKSENRKFDAGASSCPPVMRLKSIQNDLDVAGDKSSKSWNNPQPKRRKRIGKICELPKDFIEEKKAYFKEIDDFELVEEEATPDELD